MALYHVTLIIAFTCIYNSEYQHDQESLFSHATQNIDLEQVWKQKTQICMCKH